MDHLKWPARPAPALGVAVLMTIAAALPPHSGAPGRPAGAGGGVPIAMDRLWDDGRAEYSLYTGTTLRYGQPRPTEARLVVVKEDLLRDSLVKSEAGPLPGRTTEVLKLNFTTDFRTGTYTYHQAASVFLERRTLEVLKETMAHHELCGITFVRVGPRHGRMVHEAHSYWEGEADREVPLEWPAGEHTHYDALPVWLRQWAARPEPRLERSVWLLPDQVSGRSPIESTRPFLASIRMSDAGTLTLPAGRFASRCFEVTTPQGTDRFWFDAAFPHVLLKVETAAGRRLELRKTLRLDYWRHNAEGDERLLL